MSSFVVNPTHHAILAARVCKTTSKFGDAPKIAETLARANVASVARVSPSLGNSELLVYREADRSQNGRSYLGECRRLAMEANSRFATVPALRILGMIKCSRYQTQDDPNWRQSEAKDILDYLFNVTVYEFLVYAGLECGWEWAGDANAKTV